MASRAAHISEDPRAPDPKGVGAPGFSRRPPPRPRSGGWSAVSLFSGGGGLDLGFAFEGIETCRAYEADIAACRVHARNLNAQLCRQDLAIPLLNPPKADVLLAGAPCQGFSTLGKRNVADPRNGLLSSIVAASIAIRPKVIVVENVPAALSGSVQGHWLQMEQALREQGFIVRRVRLNASDYGVAQNRKRLFLIAWRGSGHIQPSFISQSPITVAKALEGIEGEECVLRLPSMQEVQIARHIGPGQKLSNVRFSGKCIHTWDIPEVFGRVSDAERATLLAVGRLRRRSRTRDYGDGDPVTLARINEMTGFDCEAFVEALLHRRYLKRVGGGVELFHTFNGKYRRLDPNGQSPTVDTHFGRMTNFVHPHADRAMSLRETLRLQGFPDWYRLEEAQSAAFRICGNAVPPPLAGAIAHVVREAILKS